MTPIDQTFIHPIFFRFKLHFRAHCDRINLGTTYAIVAFLRIRLCANGIACSGFFRTSDFQNFTHSRNENQIRDITSMCIILT